MAVICWQPQNFQSEKKIVQTRLFHQIRISGRTLGLNERHFHRVQIHTPEFKLQIQTTDPNQQIKKWAANYRLKCDLYCKIIAQLIVESFKGSNYFLDSAGSSFLALNHSNWMFLNWNIASVALAIGNAFKTRFSIPSKVGWKSSTRCAENKRANALESSANIKHTVC